MLEKVNIKNYREKLGFSQDALGSAVGVARQTIASWESGETSPTIEEFVKISRSMKIPIELLLGLEDEQETGLLFRADDPSTLTTELRFELSRKAKRYRELEEILDEKPSVPFSRPLNEYDTFVIKDTAEETRNWLGVGDTAPLSESYTLLESRGLKIIEHPLPDDISGFSAYTVDAGALLVVNSKQQIERRFFTCMHELAHLIFHRQEYALTTATTIKKGKDVKEKCADAFAGAVLLPDKVVHSELHGFKNDWIPLPVLCDLKFRYWVSMQTIVLRARDSGLISQQQCGVQIGYLKKHNMDMREENKLKPSHNLSRVKRLAFKALLDGNVTTTFVKELLGMKPSEIHAELKQWERREE